MNGRCRSRCSTPSPAPASIRVAATPRPRDPDRPPPGLSSAATAPGLLRYDVAAFVPQTALFLASNLGATVREAARFADCPRVTDCVVRFVGLGLAAEATTPVATALRVDIQDDATAELIGRKDKTFFDDVERRGIKVVVLSGGDSDGATTEE